MNLPSVLCSDGRTTVRRPLSAGALAVFASRPAAGPALAFLELFPSSANAAFSGCRLPGILDPADELIARQRRDVLPGHERRDVGDQLLAQVCGQLVHHPTGHALNTHGATVVAGARFTIALRPVGRDVVAVRCSGRRSAIGTAGERRIRPDMPESDRHARRAVASVCARRQRHTPLRRSVARLCRPSGLGRVLPRLTRRGVALAERGQRGRAGSRSHTCCATGHSLRSTCLAWCVGRPSRSVGWLGRRRAVGKSGEPGRCRGRSAT